MTKEQFNEIKERLAKWREERKLTYKNQREGFLGNVFEEISEYFRAKNDLERIDALCDMAVFSFNAFNIKYIIDFEYRSYEVDSIIEDIINDFSISIHNKMIRFEELAYKTIYKIEHLCDILGFDFYKCMLETIKEISSRTGKYDESIGKFIKDKGVYTKEEAKKIYPKCNIEDIGDGFMIFDYKGHTKDYLIKWYKANYESCKL